MMAGQGLNPLSLGGSENTGSSESESTTTESLVNTFATSTKHTSDKRPLVSYDNRDIYVDPTGDDSVATENVTQANPLKTIQEALDRMPIILRHQYRIHLADGTYPENFQMDAGHFIGSEYDGDGNAFFIEGNPSNPTNVVIDGNPNLANTVQGETDKPLIKDLEIGGTLVGKAGSYQLNNVTFSNDAASTLTDNSRSVAVSVHAPGTVAIDGCTFTADAYDIGMLLARGATGLLEANSGKLSHYVAEVERGAELRETQGGGTVWGERGFVNLLTGGVWSDVTGQRRDGDGDVLYDDFADGRLTNRLRPPVGGYRPAWDTYSGSPTVTSESLSLPDGSSTAQALRISTLDNRFTTGTWEFKYHFQSDPTSGNTNFRLIREDGDNYWVLRLENDGNLQLLKVEGGSATFDVITGSWGDDTNEHTLKVTRDTSGEWEVFVDGSSQGTATDTFVPRPDHVPDIVNQANVEVRVPVVNCRA